ncbi:hypothetical protein E2P81_ATG05711 [Venturia nashicola]|uniref:Nuclear pore complex subunit Nup192 n=1 Tax=Venturia nashicola TaxID=86259 RepID=A0A4Z1P914_9PEZI|nr:hypothetical protein E6O75_ATG05850 [Venturia nashicola]TLD29417.1 hypothetical protein E2P81_ATG05711 [Venturia nashicola]
MAEEDTLDALQGLHRDLLAFCENRLQDIDRLVQELEGRIDEFRALLDKKPKNDKSRQEISKSPFPCNDNVYEINEDFKQQAIEIAEELDLDEVEAARLLILAQEQAPDLDRSPIASVIINFHKRRQFLLECLWLVIKISQDDIEADSVQHLHFFAEYKKAVLNISDGTVENGSKYWQKCFNGLSDIETWLHKLSERSQRANIIGAISEEGLELLQFETASLLTQHESLSVITSYLVKDTSGYTYHTDFTALLDRLKRLEKHDLVMMHYLPIVLTFIARFGNADAGECTDQQRDDLNTKVLAEPENQQWSLRNMHAAVYICWSAEYFSKYKADSRDAEKKEEDAKTRFQKALHDGGLHFLLSVAQDVHKSDWYDPAKAGLVSFLMQDAPALPSDSPKPSEQYQQLLMDQLQNFVDAFITNMPNTLRNLKFEEDNQRRELLSRFNRNTMDYQYHLERFLVLLAFAYEDCPEAALTFWEDKEGNLYGFLQWAAKRQTTPRVAAFCEMLRSLSENEQCATAAHRFLLDEGTPVAGKLRRTGSLSWTQIYAEIEYYATSIKERPTPVQSSEYAANQLTHQVVEPESAMMLECYLRLVTHICQYSDEARFWVLETKKGSFSLEQILFQLAASNIDGRLRACAFKTLSSLLTGKTRQVGHRIWVALDSWISGTDPSLQSIRSSSQSAPAWSEQMIFEALASTFEESNAFIALLNTLITPYNDEASLTDSLPFPEMLKTYRPPGIDSYVDFAVGKVFGERSTLLTDQVQLRILRLNALDFVATCLSTFNENLVVVANMSPIPLDSSKTPLEEYVRLHPFGRVMEWMFNENVLNALFAAAHQDLNEVNAASPDSPLILSLVRSVEVMNLIMKLQATYLEIVRPVIKTSPGTRRPAVPHSAIATFEDALLNNLQVIVDLGLYCGTGHQELTIASLALLEKLSSSRKLVVSPSAGFGKHSDRSKLIGVFEKDNEAERVARSLIAELELDWRELEGRQEAPGYVIKTNLLSFLKNCLLALPNRPTLAHLLLGYVCGANDLDIANESLFASGSSLFHAVARLALEYPEVTAVPIMTADEELGELVQVNENGGQQSYFAWLNNIKEACIEILRSLWRSPLSSSLTLTELRSNDFIFVQAVRQGLVNANTLWDGVASSDPSFLFSDSALALRNFLRQRTAFYDLFSRELRIAVKENMTSLRSRLQASLLGSTTFPGDQATQNLTIFDLFDFMELDIKIINEFPSFDLLKDVDFEICKAEGPGSSSPYDLASVRELIMLRKSQLVQEKQIIGDVSHKAFLDESDAAITFLLGINQQHELEHARAEALRYWVQLGVIAVGSFEFDPAAKTSFVLQIVQLILPKLERAFAEDDINSRVTSRTLLTLLQPLMRHIDFEESSGQVKSMDFGNDRVFQVFRVCLNGIFGPGTDAELRELCYQICFQFLRSFSKISQKGSPPRRHTLRSVKLAGNRLMDVLCDDAYSGQGTCRISALLFLEALVLLTNQETSKFMLEAFSRVNFVGVLVDGIKQMPVDLQNAPPEDIASILLFYKSSLSLLLRISQTRIGATAALNASLFNAIRDSQIFAADPDIGLEMENPDALSNYFDLMLAVLRIVNAVVLSRGNQNDQTVKLARDFLSENRASMVSVFKRHGRVGGLGVVGGKAIDLEELVEGFTLLISACGFLEYENGSDREMRTSVSVFS